VSLGREPGFAEQAVEYGDEPMGGNRGGLHGSLSPAFFPTLEKTRQSENSVSPVDILQSPPTEMED
jgi:hypothetical protein